MRKTEIRCLKCGIFLMELKIKGKTKFRYKCPKCKYEKEGILSDKKPKNHG